ncbi:hypothetical protein COU17_00285 [Candidatus Kaiserbacteria bacterium CG10_big_fil_rev_8_21_14_0_10_49_17]|uniref:Uncharacterized protein n=1 Tax=Candidatus Kaiserbacteria bacterium CG10_big_fil_rev_8_21_14_0_10_49_17 TaxID=1974609 RepID=A0A2M6WF85_9BACT|nr:MAG: hypothetical protein COU17_00285 [Candidatus Kaiserbacteria bacterium CG10_big_fil_rev_8_21_14_0_10_49_17]
MSLLFWGLTIGTVGKIILGLTVVMVHWRIVKEHRIDRKVLNEMRRERNLALLGILFMVLGYTLEVLFYGFTPWSSGAFQLIEIIQ